MKRKNDPFVQFITCSILVLFLIFVLSVVAKASGYWTPRQEQAHQIADIARNMGLTEDDPIIVRASEIWWSDVQAHITDSPFSPLAEKGEHDEYV